MAVARVAGYRPVLLLIIASGLLLPCVIAPAGVYEGCDGPTFTGVVGSTAIRAIP